MSVNARSLANRLAQSISIQERRQAISTLLDDVKAYKDVLASLEAIKALGRVAQGSEELASKDALKLMLQFALATTDAATPDVQLEAWRILCNTLKLHENARGKVAKLDWALTGMTGLLLPSTCFALQFVVSRAIFLLTVAGGEINRILVQSYAVIPILYDLLQSYGPEITINLSNEQVLALSEHLKLIYNLAIFYPRLQAIDPKSSPLSSPMHSPSLSASQSSSASIKSFTDNLGRSSPSTITQSASAAFGKGIRSVLSKLPSPNSSHSSPKANLDSVKQKNGSISQTRALDQLASPIISIALSVPFDPSKTSPQPPLSHALHTLSEFACSAEWFDTFDSIHSSLVSNNLTLPSTSTVPTTQIDQSMPPLLIRLIVLVDSCLESCFPGTVHPDEETNLQRLRRATESDIQLLDSELAPLLLLIRKCVIGDEFGRCGRNMRAQLLSDTMDRSEPLDHRNDLTGRLARLMSSIYFAHTKVGAGELLFALCAQDADDFARTVGYGLASGFLASNGILVPPPDGYDQKFDGMSKPARAVNPITGAYQKTPVKSEPQPLMTDEEKEAEADKLFVLFDRMAKNGVMSVENPIKKAQESGKMQELDARMQQEDLDKAREEEEADEREAEEEMRKWKARMRA